MTVLDSTTQRGRPTTDPLRQPEGLDARGRRGRALLLIAISVLLPGSAQLVAGSRRVGRIALRVWLLAVAALLGIVAALAVDRGWILGMAGRPTMLLLGGAVLLGLGLGWAAVVIDAWRLARAAPLTEGARRATAIATVAALVLILVPTGYGAWLANVQRGFIGSVFGGSGSLEPVDGRYNVLILGGDAGSDRIGLRPDSIQVASVDAETGRTAIFGLPRNLQNIPFPEGTPMDVEFPDGWSCGDECLLNAIYTYAAEHPDLYPDAEDPGAEATKDAAEGITGLQVQSYVLVDLDGFSHLVDALGGVEIDVVDRVPIGGGTSPVSGYIEPGLQRLDGFDALWYARSREGSSDYARMGRQGEVMTAMIAQLEPSTVLTRFQQLASASADILTTDVPQSALDDLIRLADKARTEPVERIQFTPPDYTPVDPDYAAIRAAVEAATTPAAS